MKAVITPIEKNNLSEVVLDRIIEMAWEDRTPFDAIRYQFGLSEAEVKALMKKELKFSSYILWRKRVESCKTKHLAKRVDGIDRFKCSLHCEISQDNFNEIYLEVLSLVSLKNIGYSPFDKALVL